MEGGCESLCVCLSHLHSEIQMSFWLAPPTICSQAPMVTSPSTSLQAFLHPSVTLSSSRWLTVFQVGPVHPCTQPGLSPEECQAPSDTFTVHIGMGCRTKSLHGLARDVVSDRGPQFTAQNWSAFCRLLDMLVSISSRFHPQSNSQLGRLNQAPGLEIESGCNMPSTPCHHPPQR